MRHRRASLSAVPREIMGLSARTPQETGVLLSDVEPEEIEWLWEGRIPRGKLTILDGDPGLGKSAFTTDLAARVTVGRTFPDGRTCPKGGVVLLNAEDGLADTIRPRFDAAGGDATKVVSLVELPDEMNPEQDRVFSIGEDLPVLEKAIERVGAVLIIVDPLMAFMSSETNSHKDQDVRRILTPLAKLAERTNAAVLVVRHLNKGQGGNPLYRGGGSIGIIGAARSGLMIAEDPDDPDEESRILAASKNNLAEKASSLTFRVATAANGAARIEWMGGSALNARELLKAPVDEEEKSALDEAKDFLKEALDGRNMSAAQVMKDAHKAGIAVPTLRRAKAALKVKSEKVGEEWVWPALEGSVDNQGDQTQKVDHLDNLDGKTTHLQENEGDQGRLSTDHLDYLGYQGDQGRLSSPGAVDHLETPANKHIFGQGDQDDQDDQGLSAPSGVSNWRTHPLACQCDKCMFGE